LKGLIGPTRRKAENRMKEKNLKGVCGPRFYKKKKAGLLNVRKRIWGERHDHGYQNKRNSSEGLERWKNSTTRTVENLKKTTIRV